MDDFTPETYAQRARTQQVPIASEATWEYLAMQLMIYRPAQVLEIGAAVGSTTCRIGACVAPRQGRVVGYEISYPSYQRARRRRNQTQCRNVHLFHADVTQCDLSFSCRGPVDFVFIDGMKAQYATYLHQIRPYCRVGSCLILDDVHAYADKMDALREYIDAQWLAVQIVRLADGDSVAKIILE